MGNRAKKAINILCQIMEEEDIALRRFSIKALRKIDSQNVSALGIFKRACSDEDCGVRDAAKYALEEAEANKKKIMSRTVPQIIEEFIQKYFPQNPEFSERNIFSFLMEEIQKNNPNNIQTLENFWDLELKFFNKLQNALVENINKKYSSEISYDVIIQYLSEQNTLMKRSCQKTLELWWNENAILELTDGLEHPNDMIQIASVKCMQRIPKEFAMEPLIKGLKRDNLYEIALQVLKNIDPCWKKNSIDILVKMLDDSDMRYVIAGIFA